MKRKSLFYFYISVFIVLPLITFSQVGINTNTPHSSAALDVTSNNKGLLMPRMTELQRFTIPNPSPGLMIWCLDCGPKGQMQVFDGVSWTDVVGAVPAEGPCGFPSVTFTYNNMSVTYNTVVNNGRCWLDRNLGSMQVATSSTDEMAYGDLFQWGRLVDGHQQRTSVTTSTLSSTDIPGHGDFIATTALPNDWRNPQRKFLWQGKLGINNPCPTGFRIPTEEEMNEERLSWSSNNSEGAFGSPLKLPTAGQRNTTGGLVTNDGRYWTSTEDGTRRSRLTFTSTSALVDSTFAGRASSVRCIKDISPEGTIQALECSTPSYTNPPLFVNVAAANGVFVKVPYTGGNGGYHAGQTVQSTNVTGLTAYLYPGQFADGSDSLTYFITGTPSGTYGSGNAQFALNIGGETCTLEIFVCGTSNVVLSDVPGGGPTNSFYTVISNGRCWADRNLGAFNQASSSNNSSSYGFLFQWGRNRAPHAFRTSLKVNGPINTDQGEPNNFIFVTTTPFDWRSPANTSLWQGEGAQNNPCDVGNWRVPTQVEWNTERLSWSSNNAAGAFASPLKLTVAGLRDRETGILGSTGTEGNYWSSTIGGNNSIILNIESAAATTYSVSRGYGASVRCILD
jgi:hypothetical protein